MSNHSLPFDIDSFSPSNFTNQQSQYDTTIQQNSNEEQPPQQQLQSDTEEFFSLDMLSTDMDFEQAYNRYSSLQQKSAMLAVEHLQTVQALNQQYVNMFMSDSPQPQPQLQQTQQHLLVMDLEPRPGIQERQSSFPGNQLFQFGGSSSAEFEYHRQAIMNNDLSQQPNYSTSKFLATQEPSIDQQDGDSSDSPASSDDSDYDTEQNTNPNVTNNNNNNNEFDQFFSNTESNALEKFLDNLASNDTNPFEFYQQQPGQQSQDHVNEFNEMFDLHTMKHPLLMPKSQLSKNQSAPQQQQQRQLQQPAPPPQQQQNQPLPPPQQQQSPPQQQQQTRKQSQPKVQQEELIHELLKREITEAFTHSPLSSLSKFPPVEVNPSQLPTPLDSRQSSSLFVDYNNRKNQVSKISKHQVKQAKQSKTSTKRSLDDINPQSPPISPSQLNNKTNEDTKPEKKKRKPSSKPLLTLEQKRLNHSNSEQKRRQLCKLAYDRCLRLVTNVDDYKNEIVMALAMLSLKKKLKRKQLTKDGLPNLSKHTALLKISNEIVKIKRKNEGLQKLIDELSLYAY